jgi:flagellar basal-body rod protein FlgB
MDLNSLTSTFTIDVVSKALDGLSMRHKAIASNLANVDTPNYHRKMVSFEDSLQQAIANKKAAKQDPMMQVANNNRPLPLKTAHPGHFSPTPLLLSLEEVNPQMSEATGWEYRIDGNSVDIETEMTQLAKNTARFEALAEMQKRMIDGLKRVINSGGDG